jgi:hypothetical protein
MIIKFLALRYPAALPQGFLVFSGLTREFSSFVLDSPIKSGNDDNFLMVDPLQLAAGLFIPILKKDIFALS